MNGTIDLNKAITNFFSEYLPYERNMSQNTIKSYRDTFVQFFEFMRDSKGVSVNKLSLSHVTKDNVLDFLKCILDEHHCSATTRNNRLAAIHSFVRFLQYREIGLMAEWQRILSIRALKIEKKSFEYLTPEGIKLLLAQPDTSTYLGRKHLTMLALMYETGARVQEIADLTVGALRIASTPYTIRIVGMGNKARTVPLMSPMVEMLRTYLEENHLTEHRFYKSPLFPNRVGHKITRQGITYILETYARMAWKENPDLIPERLSPHCIRHSRAMALLKEGVNIIYIRDLLGHVSIQSTNVYARADSDAKRKALEEEAYEDISPKTNRELEKDKNTLDWLKGL